MPSADFIVPVEIESQTHNVYVIKRPGVDMFLKAMGEIYEVVVFTASLSKVCLLVGVQNSCRLIDYLVVPPVRRPGARHA